MSKADGGNSFCFAIALVHQAWEANFHLTVILALRCYRKHMVDGGVYMHTVSPYQFLHVFREICTIFLCLVFCHIDTVIHHLAINATTPTHTENTVNL